MILTRLNLRNKPVRSLDSCAAVRLIRKCVGEKVQGVPAFVGRQCQRMLSSREKIPIGTHRHKLIATMRSCEMAALHITSGSWIESSCYLFWFIRVVAAVMCYNNPHTMCNTHPIVFFLQNRSNPITWLHCMTFCPPMAWQLAPLILYINFRTQLLQFPLQWNAVRSKISFAT
jgi:hypothetical protein